MPKKSSALEKDADASMPEMGDTNMDMLPGKKVKAPKQAEEEEEAKPMSKRKKRKLEQLQKKRESRSLRSELLSELQKMQLTTEQAQLMRASQSTRVSRRDQVANAKRRMAVGAPLTEDQQRLKQKSAGKKPNKADAENEDEISEKSDTEDEATPGACGSDAVAPVVERINYADPFAQLPPEPAEEPPVMTPSTSSSSRSVPPPVSTPVISTHLRQKVRVQRTELIEEQRSKLPAVMCEQEVVETVLSNDVCLVSGDTGCGKSTQIPQFLYEAGVCNGSKYLIGVTQPRRVAAISVSQRVGEELNEPGAVGYQVRYDKSHCSDDTKIKFMTDGILLRELQADFLCQKYTAIIIDEAHERGVNCDILIGLLSRAAQRRRRNYEEALAAGRYDNESEETLPPPPLRLVIMSATLRVCDFTENQVLFPKPPPVVKIDARTFPVTVHFARSTEEDYIKAAQRSVLQIHKQLPPGTILVFVTGKQEVHRLCRMLRRSNAELRNKTAEQAAEELEADDAEHDDLGLLQGSDDEDAVFDDDLGAGKNMAAKEEDSSAKNASSATANENADPDRQNTADDTSGENKKSRRLKKKRKQNENEVQKDAAGAEHTQDKAEEAAESAPAADIPPTKKRKKKRKANEAAPQAASTAPGAESAPKAADTAAATEATEIADECDVNFRINTEEDVVVLEGDSVAAEDQKDFEARRQKRMKMARLDKSRTAGGVFKGCGFGEGPIRVFPLYAQLAARDQLQAFTNPKDGERNVIISTNVAETSVTLPNVRFVVDSGQEKRRKYKASSGVSAFTVDRISKASADQRAGRAGRLGPGHSYRLYSAAAYENHMQQFAPIAVLHVPMDPVLLLIASLGVPYLDLFPWPTPPKPEAVSAAMTRLEGLGALARTDSKAVTGMGRALQCTQLGFRLATLPVAPRYAKMLLSAVTASENLAANAIAHACALVAAFSVGNLVSLDAVGSIGPDFDPDESLAGENELVRAQREAQKRLREAQGKELPKWTQLKDDADGLLWIMGGYAWAISAGEEKAEKFCRDNRLNSRQMSEAHSLMQQLGSLLQKRLALEACGAALQLPLRPRPPTPDQAHQLRTCIANGLVDHIAVATPDRERNSYVCKDLGPDTSVFIHSASNSYRHRPRPTVMVFNDIISSSRHFMRDCVGVDPLLLSKRAALGDCPLLQLGEFLAVPAPRYLKDKDSVLGFASPSYVPLNYTLPTIEVEVPADKIFKYKVFAKALLEGEVLPNLPAVGPSLLARPALVLHSPNNPRVMGIVGPLFEKRIGSRAGLLQHWQKDRHFLLEGYLKWLPPALHDDTRMSWPPQGSSRKR